MSFLDRFRRNGTARRDARRGRSGRRRAGEVKDAVASRAPSWPPVSEESPGKTVAFSRPPAAGAEPPLQSPPPGRPPEPPTPEAAAVETPTLYDPGPERAQGPVVGVLVCLEGKLQGQVYRLFDGENKLGRAEQCQVVLPSGRISRQHALVTHRDGRFEIKPLSDQNPTIVNGEQVEETELKDGDDLKLGADTFRFRAV